MFALEALPAKHGDALLLHFGDGKLIVIDGGPPGVFTGSLQPRLKELRKERKLAEDKPLEIELMMVSHIDADHITGLLDLTEKVEQKKRDGQPAPWKIRRFWFNSFDDTIAGGKASGAEAAEVGGADVSAASTEVFDGSKTVNAESVKQGRDLANRLRFLGLDGNAPFKGTVVAGKHVLQIGDLKLTVIGPNDANLKLLRDEWAKELVPILKKEGAKAKVADFVDNSPANLSSIVVLAEMNGKTMLLTGDGRGDHTLDELTKAGLLANGPLEIDVLKLPHHGSVRNVADAYFQQIRAKHYVVSADGKYDNPDLATMKAISKARPDDDFTIHFTYDFDNFTEKEIGKTLRKFFDGEKAAGRKYEIVMPEAGKGTVVSP
ncbi:MAG: MBL fold metallo-hydrolase [Acidobacteria bacterium]|nr:MBL fold metallo-hydrolase [Acidobacteriota bacterium]